MLLFNIICGIWLLSEILLNRLLRSKANDKKGTDKQSLGTLWVVIIISIFIGVFISYAVKAPVCSHSVAISYVGLSFVLLGVILRLIIIKSLGKFFTVDVTIRENHQLKKDGIYKYLRHPSYAASLISFLGMGIALNNWFSLLIIVVPVFCAFAYRIKVEEEALIQQFGNEYIEYKKRTKGLIPFVW